MISQEFGTLAYTNSPKASKRTTFQDELQAAVSARASKAEKDRYSYSDDFNDDDDDFLNELLKSREKKAAASKAKRNKAKTNDFDISDDESKRGRTKRVSFLKTQRVSVPSEETAASDLHGSEPDPCGGQSTDNNSLYSLNASEDNGAGEFIDARTAEKALRKSFSFQSSEDAPLDESVVSADSVGEPSYLEEKVSSAVEQGRVTPQPSALDHNRLSSADSGAAKEPPKPKPRQRTLAMSLQAAEKTNDDAESLDLSQAQTSSVSIPFSTDTSTDATHMEGDGSVSRSLSKDSSGKSEHTLLTKSTIDSASGDRTISDDSKEQDSTSFEEQDSIDHSHKLSRAPEKPPGTRASSSHSRSSRRSSSSSTKKVESKYLGSLKVLDRKVLLKDPQSQGPDSLRAAIYQDWLQKKNEKSKESVQKRRKEELLRDRKKKAEDAKKVEAVASYEAWKEKKAEMLRLKAKERLERSRKEQRELEEREEKKLSAKQVYEKWKEEHDNLLKEKFRKQKEKENKLKIKKEEQEEERKRDCRHAFSNWCERKKHVIRDRAVTERTAVQNKEEEERYIKEEKDKMSVEMYEQWLEQKDLQQKRQQEEKRIQEILRESPPPPWSPPNKTVPFGK